MFDIDSWQEIWVTISRNKLRSILTGFGVFWGIFMLIVLMGAGNGFGEGMSRNVAGFASNSSFYWADRTSEAYKGFRKGRSWDMNNRDITLIKDKARTVDYISPTLWGAGGDKNVVRGQKTGSYGVRGVYAEEFLLQKQTIHAGRVLSQLDISQRKKVCVIGQTVYETLFGKNEDAIGQKIRVNGIYFQVIGVVSPKSGVQIGGDGKETVYIPFTTMQATFTQGDIIHFLGITTKPGYEVAETQEEVRQILKEAHSISPDDMKAVAGFNVEKEFQIFTGILLGISALAWIVGLGALFSGIIGISNIMLVTVRERTREIGVRRALGAKPMQIMVQILSESFVLTTIAGLIGFMCGIGLLQLINTLLAEVLATGNVFAELLVSFNVAILAMVILIVSGILAGIMPAMRALNIKAIDAIRDE